MDAPESIQTESTVSLASQPTRNVSWSSFILWSLIIVIAALVRDVGLETTPPPFFRDEAEKGYNAWCLWETGCDYEEIGRAHV